MTGPTKTSVFWIPVITPNRISPVAIWIMPSPAHLAPFLLSFNTLLHQAKHLRRCQNTAPMNTVISRLVPLHNCRALSTTTMTTSWNMPLSVHHWKNAIRPSRNCTVRQPLPKTTCLYLKKGPRKKTGSGVPTAIAVKTVHRLRPATEAAAASVIRVGRTIP